MKILHYFNPGHENAVLNNLPSYTAPSNMVRLMRELASLPAWYAGEDDIVLVGDDFDNSYHRYLVASNMGVSNIHVLSDLYKYNELLVCAWGFAPQVLRFFNNLEKDCFTRFILSQWDEKYIYWNSRMFARDILEELILHNSYFSSLPIPVFTSDLEVIKSILKCKLTDMLVKSPYSSSGRGLLWLNSEVLTQSEKQILQGMLNRQGQVSIEPIYDKRIDFAMEFMSDGNGEVSFVGYSLFKTNGKGAYQGNILLSQFEIGEILCGYVDNSILLDVKQTLEKLFSNICSSIYKGCIGVDMMIYCDGDNHSLHPCVEINMRYNMGYLAIKLYENHISPNSSGTFNIDFDAQGETFRKHIEMQKELPLVVEDGKIESGYLSLCPINERTHYRAYVLVEKL